MADYGVKIALPGKDISSANPEDFAFTSQGGVGSVKIALQPGTPVSVTVPAGTTLNVSITHNLGFIPVAMIFAERTPGSGRFHFGSCFQSIDDRTNPVQVVGAAPNTYADATVLNVQFHNPAGVSQTVKLYYYIFGDAGS